MDLIISLGQKNPLAKYMILFDAENRPPMLDKDLYDSWKSHNGVIITKKYVELSAAKKIQVDCDMNATNIILQGLIIRKYFLAYTRTEVRKFRDTLTQHMESVKKSINKRAQHKREYDSRMNERQMQSKEGKVDSSKALDADLVLAESSGIESEKNDTSSRSENDTHAEDADIKPIKDKEPTAEAQLTAQHNVLAYEQIILCNLNPFMTHIC
uniref:Uncharacterized protein n=1 Tax=Tanacetum cinerariifolium TaxID=118510 RepID=A0A699JU36_TANCI|nr:hypothetical protein [Tanacetum cinerariifolium]